MNATAAQEKKPGEDTKGGEVPGDEAKTGEEAVPIPQPPATLSTASLYVGDLAPTVDEVKLKAKFNEVGHVLSVRVCRDALTRQSLRYGYVNFDNHTDAQKAMTDLNFEPLDSQPMRIMWSERDPEKRRRGKGNLFIKNLGDHVDSKAIYDTFTMFGAILSCKVVLDEYNKSKGYGFIHFENEESAVQAIEKVNGMELDGKNIYVGPFLSRTKRNDMSEETYTNVYVDNFDEKVDEEKLKGLFSLFGNIKSVVVKQSPNGPPGKFYGFVDFEKHDDAVKAVSELNGKEWEGHVLTAGRAMHKSERQALHRAKRIKWEKEIEQRNRSNLYVRFYDAISSDEELKKVFEQFGTVTSAKVMRDEHGCSRNFGFVNFADEVDAKRALTEMDHKLINGKPISVAMAQSKHKRQEMLKAMSNTYQSQMQRQGPALYSRVSQQLPGPMQPVQQVRITPNPYNQPYRSMSVSYPPVGMQSQQMMRGYSTQPLNYGMGYPNMGAMPMQYANQMHRPVQPQLPVQSYANVARASVQGSTFTTVPPVQHSQMDSRGKDVGVAKMVEDFGAMGMPNAEREKGTIQTADMREALIQPVTDVLKKDERVGFDASGVINLVIKHNSPSNIMSAMKDEKKLAEMIRAVIGNPKTRA